MNDYFNHSGGKGACETPHACAAHDYHLPRKSRYNCSQSTQVGGPQTHDGLKHTCLVCVFCAQETARDNEIFILVRCVCRHNIPIVSDRVEQQASSRHPETPQAKRRALPNIKCAPRGPQLNTGRHINCGTLHVETPGVHEKHPEYFYSQKLGLFGFRRFTWASRLLLFTPSLPPP